MSASYTPTIGLEIHAELKTASKMFCGCKNDPDGAPANEHTCPICMGHPGTLPTINRAALEKVITTGLAVNGEIADYSEFDRKNYFYPDIPKGYQISQYQFPLVKWGQLADVKITRIHLEEDTAKSSHEGGEYSLVDFNRAGVPLMELVTEPMIHSAERAGAFARELRLLLRYLGVSDADMEKGQMRVEANISVSNSEKLGTKVEVKNLNSFRAVEKAIAHEIQRHIDALERGESISQETRGWDEVREVTFAQRKKESSHDYRYFPDPDLPKLKISTKTAVDASRLSEIIPELPQSKRKRLVEIGVSNDTVEVLVQNKDIGSFFDAVASSLEGKSEVVLASNYIASDLQSILKNSNEPSLSENALSNPSEFAEAIKLLATEKISSRGAKNIILEWFKTGNKVSQIASELGLLQDSSEESLSRLAGEIIVQNENIADEFKAGKESALQFLVGQGMKLSKGSANPTLLQQILRDKLQSKN